MNEPAPYLPVAIGSLVLCSLCYVVLGVLLGPLGGMAFLLDDPGSPPMPAAVQLGFSILIVVICLGVALLNCLAAFGLARRAKWAWFLSVILGVMYAPSLCMPFGLAILLPLFSEKTRAAFRI